MDPYTKEAGASGYRNNPKNGRFCRCRILGSRLRRGPGPASAPGSLDQRRHPLSTCDTEKCPIARGWRDFYSVSFTLVEPEAREELINRRRLEPKHQYRCVDTSIRLPRNVRRCGGCGFMRCVRSPPKNDEQCTESNNVSNNYVPAVLYPQNDRFSLGVQVRYRDSS